jgi:hypothetical protein
MFFLSGELLTRLIGRNVPTTSEIENSERSLARIRDQLAARQAELQQRESSRVIPHLGQYPYAKR